MSGNGCVNQALSKRDGLSCEGTTRVIIIAIQFREQTGEDENEYPHARSRSVGIYLPGNPLQQPAMDSHASCGGCDWSAIVGASGTRPNRIR
jgi:hypothetical protein